MVYLKMDGWYFISIENSNVDGIKRDRARVTLNVSEAHAFDNDIEVTNAINEIRKIYKNVEFEVIKNE